MRKAKGMQVTEKDVDKKNYHHGKLLKQGIKNAIKFEMKKIKRRIKEAEEKGTNGAKLQSQLQVVEKMVADEVCDLIKPEAAIDMNRKDGEKPMICSNGDSAGEGEGSVAHAYQVVTQRIAKYNCVKQEVEQWKQTLEKLKKRIEEQARPPVDMNKIRKERKAKKKSLQPPPQPNKKVKKKKNHLGQRARRMLAEQMYGRNANHLKKEEMNEQKRSAAIAEGNVDLHPSWHAKRAKEMQQKKLAHMQAGKKVVFDT